MDISQLTQYLIIGLADGALIALIALGYTLVYGVVELINFAHGEIFMMGAFFATTLITWIGVTEGLQRTRNPCGRLARVGRRDGVQRDPEFFH